ncbi:MAG: 50S ribosomal protein L15e [Candidatus Thorarchaeota archaeon]
MGFYKYINQFKRNNVEEAGELLRQRLITWRKEPSIVKIKRPTNLSRARSLGYKAKQGVILVRVKVSRGARRKSRPTKGRRSKRMGVNRITANFSRQTIAENRAARKFQNLEVFNSYLVGQDGRNLYYEVILIDGFHPSIKSDLTYNWISPLPSTKSHREHQKHKGRSLRGLTSSARKARGLRNKGKGAERFRGVVLR